MAWLREPKMECPPWENEKMVPSFSGENPHGFTMIHHDSLAFSGAAKTPEFEKAFSVPVWEKQARLDVVLTGALWASTLCSHENHWGLWLSSLQNLVWMYHIYWLVVSTPLKNINQLGLWFPIYGKMFQATNQYRFKTIPNATLKSLHPNAIDRKLARNGMHRPSPNWRCSFLNRGPLMV